MNGNRRAELLEESAFRRQQREERYGRAVRLARQGLTPTEIARLVRLGVDGVTHALKKAGVPYRRSTRDGVLAHLPMGTP